MPLDTFSLQTAFIMTPAPAAGCMSATRFVVSVTGSINKVDYTDSRFAIFASTLCRDLGRIHSAYVQQSSLRAAEK